MWGRRRRDGDEDELGVEETTEATSTPSGAGAGEPGDEGESPKSDRSGGPFDESEVDLDEARKGRVDLGGLLIKAEPGMKLQLQVDQRTGNATSAVLAIEDAAVQLIAVAAPRSSGLWGQTRLQITQDAKRRGGRAEEAPGPFGPEIRLVIPVQAPDGKQVLQPSRVSAIDGPRWMLRATFLGKATNDAAVFQRFVELVKQTVVIRGQSPMAPGDVIVLKPPAGNRAATDPSQPLQA
ncbi:DUF3710 domain-containing protein [Jiangella aurantiaca]|uniref:DUF3710 domain-containing protein n=1 Tax=Jiangella aurantiaca TaxID=2530373 RepID=A0A4R5AKN0_9ACTN|nr:DUF3710 domain-containing protein [Jiangella aurantiaca]TDD71564.1 DUF3710 domain-containing protein [Jiangella aurantiaca]